MIITLALEVHHNIPQSRGQNPPVVFRTTESQEVPDDFDLAQGIEDMVEVLTDSISKRNAIYVVHTKTGITYIVPTKHITFATVRKV